jgi:hypothetical protein
MKLRYVLELLNLHNSTTSPSLLKECLDGEKQTPDRNIGPLFPIAPLGTRQMPLLGAGESCSISSTRWYELWND